MTKSKWSYIKKSSEYLGELQQKIYYIEYWEAVSLYSIIQQTGQQIQQV